MHSSDQSKLLREVIEDANYQRFRSDTLQIAVDSFRREHRKPWRTIALASAAAIAAAALLLAAPFPKPAVRPEQQTVKDPPRNSLVIASQPISPELVVRSVSAQNLLVQTEPTAAPEVVRSTRESVSAAGDRELLALFPGLPAGIFRLADRAELVVIGQ